MYQGPTWRRPITIRAAYTCDISARFMLFDDFVLRVPVLDDVIFQLSVLHVCMKCIALEISKHFMYGLMYQGRTWCRSITSRAAYCWNFCKICATRWCLFLEYRYSMMSHFMQLSVSYVCMYEMHWTGHFKEISVGPNVSRTHVM